MQARPVNRTVTGLEAATAGAALATTTAGTAHAEPETTVRREIPRLDLDASDSRVTLYSPLRNPRALRGPWRQCAVASISCLGYRPLR